jgi:N utilization substance protein A
MSSLGTIYQSIEILSKEKGIDPKVILDAVKDAMLVAARKHFHTNEDLVAELDEKSGAIHIFGVRHVTEQVTDPEKEISLEEARATASAASSRAWRRPARTPA